MIAPPLLVDELRTRSNGTSRAHLSQVWAAFGIVMGSDIAGNRREILLELLNTAANEGALTIPSRKAAGWDKAGHPWLPPYVNLPVAKSVRGIRVVAHPWCPELAFLEDEKLAPGQKQWLIIDKWLKRRKHTAVFVPMRERSWEVFGEEKALDKVVAWKAFRTGRLDAEKLLRFFDTPEPMTPSVCASAHGLPVLVVENTAAFHSLSTFNARARQWSAVVYGRGNSFATSWVALPEICADRGTSTILYVGDIDAKGLTIPTDRLVCLSGHGLTMAPCSWIYRRMIAACAGREGRTGKPWKLGAAAAWLPADLAGTVDGLAGSALRVPQEAFGTEALLLEAAC